MKSRKADQNKIIHTPTRTFLLTAARKRKDNPDTRPNKRIDHAGKFLGTIPK